MGAALRKLAIGCDHAGYELKEFLKEYLRGKAYEVFDCGTFSKESTDYPEYAHALTELMAQDRQVGKGILICGTGNGIAMAANKQKGIRAAVCWDREVAALARRHNDANVVTLPARFITVEDAREIVDAFLEEVFEGGRHERRVNKIDLPVR